MKPVCVKCEREFVPFQIGVIVAELFMDNKKIYKLWSADLHKCPKCETEIIYNIANKPFKYYFEGGCEELVEKFKSQGQKIIYNKER